MKKGIHPEYKKLTVTLTDGSEIETRSTLSSGTLKTEVDSKNHPFYTGKRQFVDTAGRVEKFRRRYGDTSSKKEATEEKSE
jgi:large subunit ribosomal protein L31